MKIFCEQFGDWLGGFIAGIYITVAITQYHLSFFSLILLVSVMLYFIIFGSSRFTPEYRKII